MTLDAAVRVDRGAFALDVEVTAADGELVVVLGPNGAGKSTLLSALAGLLPASGRIAIGDQAKIVRMGPQVGLAANIVLLDRLGVDAAE